MTTQIKVIGFVLFMISTSFRQKEVVYIWYPSEIGITETCKGQEVEESIVITTTSSKKIKAYAFDLNKADFTLYNDGHLISKTDTLFFTEKHPIKLKLKYNIKASENLTSFTFRTNHSKYLDNQIRLKYGKYSITSIDIKEGKEQYINISESCKDSVSVGFPYGGTVSGATLYSDSSSTKKELKSVSYHIGGLSNYFMFSKSDTGRYYVRFGSCYWGNGFWLTIK